MIIIGVEMEKNEVEPFLVDSHCHYSDGLLDEQIKNKVSSMYNAESLTEYEMLLDKKLDSDEFVISLGVHPWNVERNDVDEIINKLIDVKVVGEIGLDNVWTENDLKRQKEVFRKQLMFASENRKSVVVHVKGLERECLELLDEYPNEYYIHWLSSKEYLREFVDKGYYIGVGPFKLTDPDLDFYIENIPLEQLLIETDGIRAISWSYGYSVHLNEYMGILGDIYDRVSQVKKIDKVKLVQIVNENFNIFIGF